MFVVEIQQFRVCVVRVVVSNCATYGSSVHDGVRSLYNTGHYLLASSFFHFS